MNKIDHEELSDEEVSNIANTINALTEKLGIHLVTCGNCGTIHDQNSMETSIDDDGYDTTLYECNKCGMRGDECDYPDLFY